MRLSTNPADRSYPDWRAKHRQNRITVYLDGIEARNVFEADEDEGYVERAAVNLNGDLIFHGEDVARIRLTGEVRIVLEPRARANAVISQGETRLLTDKVVPR